MSGGERKGTGTSPGACQARIYPNPAGLNGNELHPVTSDQDPGKSEDRPNPESG